MPGQAPNAAPQQPGAQGTSGIPIQPHAHPGGQTTIRFMAPPGMPGMPGMANIFGMPPFGMAPPQPGQFVPPHSHPHPHAAQ